MPASFSSRLQEALQRPVRYRRGEGVNVWASKLNECVRRLDGMDLPPDAVAAINDLLDEVGQHTRDCFSLGEA